MPYGVAATGFKPEQTLTLFFTNPNPNLLLTHPWPIWV